MIVSLVIYRGKSGIHTHKKQNFKDLGNIQNIHTIE